MTVPPFRTRLGARAALFLAIALVAGLTVTAAAFAPRHHGRRAAGSASASAPASYISLGDSLAAGLQPDAHGVDRPSGDGYADILGRRLKRVFPALVTRRLSCGGATTQTLLDGGAACQGKGDPAQLVQAERFLAAHPETKLVTVNIGDNDVEGCVKTARPRIDSACVRRGRSVIARNLPIIARRLRAAAPNVPVVGILDYDQFLALWLDGPAARAIARRSVAVISSLNALMARIYTAAGVEVADAGARFATTDLTTMRDLPGVGPVPIAVERICRWTWACSGPPINNDDHARTHGYAEISQAVLDALAAH
jgi:lysophospholipase L1-like esterase